MSYHRAWQAIHLQPTEGLAQQENLDHPAFIAECIGRDPWDDPQQAYVDAYRALDIDWVLGIPRGGVSRDAFNRASSVDLGDGARMTEWGLSGSYWREEHPFTDVDAVLRYDPLENVPHLPYATVESGVRNLEHVRGTQALLGRGSLTRSSSTEGYWQIAPYLRGLDVPRPGWIHEDWRGELLADFMITLRACSGRIPRQRHGVFSIAAFARDLAERIGRRDRRQRHPPLLSRLAPALELLDEFALVHDSLPLAFCHGDLHPLNVIWGLHGIKAVIDWEFCGHKVELYDVANLIGCAGIEHPEGLRGKLVLALIKRLRETGIIAEYSWVHLHELVIALRFAWLSEWLRSDDEEMVEMETELIGILVRERAMLRGIWAL
jgi:homoserine kinase type II